MKNNMKLGLLLSSFSLVGAKEEVRVRTSQLSPIKIRKWLNEYGVDQLFEVADDDGVRDPDEDNNESYVTILHLIARTPVVKDGEDVSEALVSLAQEVVSDKPELINAQQSGGFTPLHNAAYRGYKKIVKLFWDSVEDQAQSAAIVDKKYNKNAEEWAIEGGKKDTARILQKFRPIKPKVILHYSPNLKIG